MTRWEEQEYIEEAAEHGRETARQFGYDENEGAEIAAQAARERIEENYIYGYDGPQY